MRERGVSEGCCGVAQDLLAECGEAAAALRLRMPLSVSSRVGDMASVYTQLVHAAREPPRFIPMTPSLQVISSQAMYSDILPPLLNSRQPLPVHIEGVVAVFYMSRYLSPTVSVKHSGC